MSDATQWVSVLERLPAMGQECLAIDDRGDIWVDLVYDGGAIWGENWSDCRCENRRNVLMWCPVPQRPDWKKTLEPIVNAINDLAYNNEDDDE